MSEPFGMYRANSSQIVAVIGQSACELLQGSVHWRCAQGCATIRCCLARCPSTSPTGRLAIPARGQLLCLWRPAVSCQTELEATIMCGTAVCRARVQDPTQSWAPPGAVAGTPVGRQLVAPVRRRALHFRSGAGRLGRLPVRWRRAIPRGRRVCEGPGKPSRGFHAVSAPDVRSNRSLGVRFDKDRHALQFGFGPACWMLHFPDESSVGDLLAFEIRLKRLPDVLEDAPKPLNEDRSRVLDLLGRQRSQSLGPGDLGRLWFRALGFIRNEGLDPANGWPLASHRGLRPPKQRVSARRSPRCTLPPQG